MRFLSLAQEPVSRQIQDQDNHHCYLILLHLQRNQGLQNHHHLRQNHDHRYREQILFQNQSPLYDLHLIHHRSGSHLRLHPRILPHRHTRNHLHPRIPRRRHTRNRLHPRIQLLHRKPHPIHHLLRSQRFLQNHFLPDLPRQCLKLLWMNLPGFQSLHPLTAFPYLQHLHR